MGLNGTGHARLHRGTVLGFATAAVAGPVVRRSPDLELVGACDGTVTAPWSTTLTRREQRAMVPPIASPGGPRRPPGNVGNLGGEWISLRFVLLASSAPVSMRIWRRSTSARAGKTQAPFVAIGGSSPAGVPCSLRCLDDRQSWRCQIWPTGTDGVAFLRILWRSLFNNNATSMLTKRSLFGRLRPAPRFASKAPVTDISCVWRKLGREVRRGGENARLPRPAQAHDN